MVQKRGRPEATRFLIDDIVLGVLTRGRIVAVRTFEMTLNPDPLAGFQGAHEAMHVPAATAAFDGAFFVRRKLADIDFAPDTCLARLARRIFARLLRLSLNGVNQTLEPKKIRVELNDEAKDLLVEHGYDPKLGARPMRRIVQKTVENIVAKAVLGGDLGDGGTIQIDAKMIEESLE